MAAVLDLTGTDLQVYRGSDYTLSIRFWTDSSKSTGVDLSGRTYQAVIRRGDFSTSSFAFVVDTTNAATGVLVLSMSHDITATVDFDEGEFVLEENASGVQTTLLVGQVDVDEGIAA